MANIRFSKSLEIHPSRENAIDNGKYQGNFKTTFVTSFFRTFQFMALINVVSGQLNCKHKTYILIIILHSYDDYKE